MGDIFDLDALAAEVGQPEVFTFRFGGELFELPAVLDLRLAGAFAAGQGARPDQTLAALLGEDQWQRMLAVPAPLSAQMTEALLERWAKHLGISLGESAGSPGS